MVVALKCPGCGSALPSGSAAQTCSYCGCQLHVRAPAATEQNIKRAADRDNLEELLSAIEGSSFDLLGFQVNRALVEEPANGNIWLCAAVAAMAAPRSFVPGAEGDFLRKAQSFTFDQAVADRIIRALVQKALRHAQSENFAKGADFLRFAHRIGEVHEMPEIFRKLWEGHCLSKEMRGESASTRDEERQLRLLSDKLRADHPEWDIPVIPRRGELPANHVDLGRSQRTSGQKPQEPRTSTTGLVAGVIISLLMSAVGLYLATAEGGWIGTLCIVLGLWFLALCVREVARRRRSG